MKFFAYPTYKPSEIDWIGSIPEDWQILRLKQIFLVLNGSTPKSIEADYWDGDIPWATPEDLGDLVGDTLNQTQRMITVEGYRSCGTSLSPVGSLILSTRAPIGHLAITGKSMCTNQGCRTLVFRNNENRRFFYYLLFAARPELESLGQGSTFKELAKSKLEDISLVLPSSREQYLIADLLDCWTNKIDALIAKKERLIELLQEKRAALINRAITMGLDKSVPMKDSGFEWLGEIPAHWEIRRNGFLFKERDERGFPELPILNVSIHTGVTLREFSQEKIEQRAEDPSTYKLARKGDLAFNKMRFWQGAVGVAPLDGLVSPDYTVAEPQDGVNAFYFENLFKTSIYKIYINMNSHGIVPDRNRLYWDQFKQMAAFFPPSGEQISISGYIGELSDKSDHIIAKISISIEKQKEYRAALISAAVTGKIDVRKAI